MILINCPICGSEKHKLSISVKDFTVSKEIFNIVECGGCGLLFTNPRPGINDIGDYYKSASYISHTNQQTGVFGRLYQFLRNRAIDRKLSWIEKHSSGNEILDYGCGTGEFLSFCSKQGWNTIGVEIADEPRKNAISRYGLNVISPLLIDSIALNKFDVVTMWHVLEHVDNLLDTVRTIVAKIKPGGLLVLALPNPESWDAKHYKEFWAAWDVPIHYYHFKKEDILRLADMAGLSLVETKNMPFDSYYISLLSEEYKTGNKKWLEAVKIGFLSNLKAGPNNASSLTYILRKL